MTRHEFTIYVPAENSVYQHIKYSSAIVGHQAGSKQLILYYEGGLYAPNMDFTEMLFSAACRMLRHYPTRAKLLAEEKDFVAVGTYSFNNDWSDKRYEITDLPTFHKWMGKTEPVEPVEDEYPNETDGLV